MIHNAFTTSFVSCLISVLLAAGSALAQTTPSPTGTTPTTPSPTTDQPITPAPMDDSTIKQTESDAVKRVQDALRGDTSFSPQAHNIKLTLQRDEVVLSGNVQSQDEKRRVEEAAARAAAPTKIRSNLQISTR